MATVYAQMPELETVVNLLKTKFTNELAHIKPERILYNSFSKKQSEIKGKISGIQKKMAHYFPDKDYLLEIHRESWNAFSEGDRLYVILHELLHIPEGGFDPDSKDFHRCVRHDILDFSTLLVQYGINRENVRLLEQKVRN